MENMSTQNTAAKRGPKPNPQTRENLLRVGAKMLHESGYTASGVKEIVDTAKVPKGSFYNHFKSKEEFGKEVVDFYFDNAFIELQALLTNETIPPLERLHTYFEKRIQGFRDSGYMRGCMLGNLSLEIADHSASIRDHLAAHFTTWSSLFEICILEAQQIGAINNQLPATQLAQFILNSWEGAMLRMRVEKSDKPLKEFTEIIFQIVLV